MDYFESSFTDKIINAVRSARGSFLKRIKYAHKWATEFAAENRDLCVSFLTISAEMVGSGKKIEEKIHKVHMRYRIFLRELIEQGKKEGGINKDMDPDILSYVINGFHNGSLLEWYMNAQSFDPRSFARTFRDVILFGIVRENKEGKPIK